MKNDSFRFKRFELSQAGCAMRIGTDGVCLGAWAGKTCPTAPKRILDIGAGTGLIGIMLAQRYAEAEVLNIEIDPEAAKTAKQNAQNSPFAKRIEVLEADFANFLGAWTTEQKPFDLIVSNPPYFRDSLACPDSKRHLARHSQSLGIEQLMAAAKLLSPSGRIALICPLEQEKALFASAQSQRLIPTIRCELRSRAQAKPKRLLSEWGKLGALGGQSKGPINEELILMDETGARSEALKTLCQDFYL